MARIAHHSFQLTFDGSFDKGTNDRLSAAGCGASLWSPVDKDGVRTCVAQASCGSRQPSAQLAEGEALRLAFWLLFILGLSSANVEIIGDCDEVVRFATLHGDPKCARLWDVLGNALLHVSAHSWKLRYTVVPRTSNVLAHRLAKGGLTLARISDFQPRVWTSVAGLDDLAWFPLPSRLPLPLVPCLLPTS
jgi:hypothetical protein